MWFDRCGARGCERGLSASSCALADFTTFTRQQSLPRPTDDEAAVLGVAGELLRRELEPGREFRLIGVAVASLEPALDQPQESDKGPAAGGQIRMRI